MDIIKTFMKLSLTILFIVIVFFYLWLLFIISAAATVFYFFFLCVLVDIVTFTYFIHQRTIKSFVKSSLFSFLALTMASLVFCFLYCCAKQHYWDIFLCSVLFHIALSVFNLFCFMIFCGLFLVCFGSNDLTEDVMDDRNDLQKY